MSDVTFNEEPSGPSRPLEVHSGGFAAMLVRMKLAPTEQEANRILLIGAGCVLLLGIFLFVRTLSFPHQPTALDLQQDREMRNGIPGR